MTFVCGSDRSEINRKFVGDMSLMGRCVITLTGERTLLLVGEPGTAKSMLPELSLAAICDTSGLTVQGGAGTTEDQLRCGWNYAQLLARGPNEDAPVDSPVLVAMRTGRVVWVKEITRCLPGVQDALASVLPERHLTVPELGEHAVYVVPGFRVIATANLRDRSASEMNVALECRLDLEAVKPIIDAGTRIALVMERTHQVLAAAGAGSKVGEVVAETLVTASRELRSGVSQEGWTMEKPPTVLSTTEAIAISDSIALAGAFLPYARDGMRLIPGQLLDAVRKNDSEDGARLFAYWDSIMKRHVADGRHTWVRLWEQWHVLEA